MAKPSSTLDFETILVCPGIEIQIREEESRRSRDVVDGLRRCCEGGKREKRKDGLGFGKGFVAITKKYFFRMYLY